MEGWAELSSIVHDYAPRLGAAILCGLILGVERERKDKPAGLRTIVLITLGSALYVLISELIPQVTDSPWQITMSDPTRIASQVVIGIGFLGAGTIIQARGAVHGLTTAATIWTAAGIGLTCGIGFPALAFGVTLVVVLTLVGMQPLRRWLATRSERAEIELSIPDDSLTYALVLRLLDEHDVVQEDSLTILRRLDGKVRIRVRFHRQGSGPTSLLDNLYELEGVEGVPIPDPPSVA